MGEIRDFFIKTLDESEGGIKQKMAQLSAMLKEKDAEVWHRLEQQNLYPQYYSFRWLTLILSQEFPLPDVVRVWDSIFSDEHRFDFLVRVCCAMIMYVSYRNFFSCLSMEFIYIKRKHCLPDFYILFFQFTANTIIGKRFCYKC